MEIKPVYEFICWPNCNNKCAFCPQRDDKSNLKLITKRASLTLIQKFINSTEFKKGSHVLIVGGEIFDDKRIKKDLIGLWDFLTDKMINDEVDLLYVNTNLIYKDLSLVSDLLDKINKKHLFNRLKFTTSYDLEGRFKNKSDELMMLSNLKSLKMLYGNIHIVVNTILTKTTCQAILTEKFNPKSFCDIYDCDINLIPYIIYDKKLSASREDIFKSLMKANELIPGYLKRYIENFDLPQDKLLYQFKNGQYTFCSSEHSDCGHSENFKMYSEAGTCFICDLKELFNDNL